MKAFIDNPTDNKIFGEMYNYYLPRLVSTYSSRFKTIDREIITDLCIDGILHSRDMIHQYDPEKAQFNTWLYTIVYRDILKYIKREFNIKYSLDYGKIADTLTTGTPDLKLDKETAPDELLKEVIDYVRTIKTNMAEAWLTLIENNYDYQALYNAYPDRSEMGLRSSISKMNSHLKSIKKFTKILDEVLT